MYKEYSEHEGYKEIKKNFAQGSIDKYNYET
jgi:hypothetical protein